MIDTILQKAISKLTNGGIVFVFLGSNHVHRLAANLLMNFQLRSQENIKLCPLKIISPYVIDGVPSRKKAEVETRAMDMFASPQAYESVACHDILCEDNRDENIYGSLELSEILQKVVDDACVSSEIVTPKHSP